MLSLIKFNNKSLFLGGLNFTQTRHYDSRGLPGRDIEWDYMSEADQELWRCPGLKYGFPGTYEELQVWREWYAREVESKRPKNFIKRFFHIYFIETFIVYDALYLYPEIKKYTDASKEYYWSLYVEELLETREDIHTRLVSIYVVDNINKQFLYFLMGWIINFIFWDYIFEKWGFSEVILEDFISGVREFGAFLLNFIN